MVSNIKSDKDSRVADAFDQTFFFTAVIVGVASMLGLFTDKKTKNKPNQ